MIEVLSFRQMAYAMFRRIWYLHCYWYQYLNNYLLLEIKKGNFQTLKIIYRVAKHSKIARKNSKCNFLPVLKCENQSENFTFDCAKISEKLQFVSCICDLTKPGNPGLPWPHFLVLSVTKIRIVFRLVLIT